MIYALIASLKVIPAFLSIAWILGAFVFYWRRERRLSNVPTTTLRPPISIIIPCHNEEATITCTIEAIDQLRYPKFEILAVNDCSVDKTKSVLESLAASRPHMRVINLLQNRGKAAALNVGIMASRHDYLMCIDADSELHADAPTWLMSRLTRSPHVAAVTGNPMVKNRSTLIGRIQVGEFSAIIGIIKRYHQVIGKLFAMSGVIIAFKKCAIMEVGLLDTHCATEDIAITWKLQRHGWDVRYEPHALCDVLMPDTLKGLWKQRMRWARGGFEVMTSNMDILLWRGHGALKILMLEYFLSISWALMLPMYLVTGLLMRNSHGVPLLIEWTYPISWGIFLTGVLSTLLFLTGFWVHGRYESGAGRYSYWAIWYPFVYWMLNSAVLLFAIPKVLFGKRTMFSTWESPDRGGLTYEETAV